MINLSLNFWQLLIAIILTVIISALTRRVVQILIKVIFSSKIVMAWNLRRQAEQHKVVLKHRQLISRENLMMFAKVMDEIDKMLPNNAQRKQFYRDFAISKQTREYWIKTLLDMCTPKEQTKPTENSKEDEKIR